jgi:hypothetical protein
MTPTRLLGEVFGATVKDTGPLPVPFSEPEKVIQFGPLVADHGHSFFVTTLKDPEPPSAAIGDGTLVGLS